MVMKRQQRGAYMVMMAILIVILIGVAALAIDVGRVLMMRTDMQNAADAAALAAAAELNSDNNAQDRARAAARDLLEHDARFARVTELLGATGLPDSAFEFFCVIGSETDVSPSDPGFTDFCSGSEVEPGKYAATSDEDTHYIRVTLDPNLAGDGDRFTVNLIFLPVLNAIGIDAAETATAITRALAGRSFFTCKYPPMALCDPWEGTGSTFRDSMPVGGMIELRQQGSNSWAPGNFGFLQPQNGGSGAADMSEYLANPDLIGCNPPIVISQPGSISQKTRSAFNVRFDEYGPPNPFNRPDAPTRFPPAPNVTEYPLDNTPLSIDGRFWTGDWNFEDYWNDNHGSSFPNGWSNAGRPTRWDVYNHEIDSGLILNEPDPSHIGPGVIPERRLMTTAVLSCDALDFQGKSTAVVFPTDGFAQIFIITKASPPGGGGSNGLKIYGEFLGWVQETDDNYHVQIQLYE